MRVEFRRWYEAEALMRDLTVHRHEILAASGEDVERRMRSHYTEAAAILVHEKAEKASTEARRGP